VRTLSRYILREVVSHAFIGGVVFTFVIFMRDLGRLLDLVVRNSAPLPSAAEIFFLTVPTSLTVTIPFFFLAGVFLTLPVAPAEALTVEL